MDSLEKWLVRFMGGRSKFGTGYSKRPWGKALLIGIAAIIGFFIFAVIVGIILGAGS
jgi:hypothetical protein